MQLTPAEYVIRTFGGVRATGRAIGRDFSAVSRWQRRVDKTGQVGGIPRVLHTVILKKAEAMGLDITADDLIYGRKVKNKKQ